MEKIFFILMALSFNLFAIAGEEILQKMDGNREFKSIQYDAVMSIQIGSQTRVKNMRATAMGGATRQAIVEYTNPVDFGTKYLMLEENLWIYFPEEDDVVKISGHLLKEGMMGSDVSYEDALESDNLAHKYAITVAGDTTYNDRECWLLSLNAKVDRVPYEKREMIVDKETFVCWKEKMFAKSGRLLKESTTLETKEIGGRNFATKTIMVNQLRRNSSTTFSMENITFDGEIDESLFTMRYLGR